MLSATVSHAGVRESGFVLIPVLWTVALLALVATTLTRSTTLGIKANATLIRRAEASFGRRTCAPYDLEHSFPQILEQ